MKYIYFFKNDIFADLWESKRNKRCLNDSNIIGLILLNIYEYILNVLLMLVIKYLVKLMF